MDTLRRGEALGLVRQCGENAMRRKGGLWAGWDFGFGWGGDNAVLGLWIRWGMRKQVLAAMV